MSRNNKEKEERKKEARTDLHRIPRKVIRRLARARVPLGQLRVAAVVGLEDGELVALRVPQLHVELAVLAVLGPREVLAGLRDERAVQERDGRQVGRQLARDGAGRAAGPGERDALDGHLVAGRAAGGCLAGRHGEGEREGGGEGGGGYEEGEEGGEGWEGEVHFGWFGWYGKGYGGSVWDKEERDLKGTMTC